MKTNKIPARHPTTALATKRLWLAIILLAIIPLEIALAQIPSMAQPSNTFQTSSTLNLKNSLMFLPEEIRQIEKALQAFHKGIDFEEEPEEIEIKEVIKKVITLPKKDTSLHLHSILFFSPQNWTAWVNGKKITSQNPELPEENIKIVDVTNKSVVILWKTNFLSLFSSQWKTNFSRIQNSALYSNNKNIVINEQKKQVSLILHPNQRFESSTFTIEEGSKKTSAQTTFKPSINTPPNETTSTESITQTPPATQKNTFQKLDKKTLKEYRNQISDLINAVEKYF